MNEFPRIPDFIERVYELKQVCSLENYKQVHAQLTSLVSLERKIRLENTPTDYVAVPICFLPPGAPPDEIDVFWGVFAPGPYTGVSGSVERRQVNTGMVVYHMNPEAGGPGGYADLDILPNGMCFMDKEDAEVFAKLMSLANSPRSAERLRDDVRRKQAAEAKLSNLGEH
jgi:hypothetical protein